MERSRTSPPAKVLAYPTETVYGFGGAIDERSVQQLVALKGRPQGKPFLLLDRGQRDDRTARSASHRLRRPCLRRASGLARFDAGAARRRKERARRAARAGRRSRRSMDAAPSLARLILAPRSSDHFHEREPARGSAGDRRRSDRRDNGRTRSRAEHCVCSTAGRFTESHPSTVVDCTGRLPRVIRPGAIPAATLREIVPDLVGDA